MTSYSLYGTGAIRFVDGSVSTDDDLAAEQIEQITNCLAAGAARALLDTTRDLSVEDPEDAEEIYAEQWHSADEGWELEAIHPPDLPGFMEYVGTFVRENLDDIIWMANRLAWTDPRHQGDHQGERPVWFHDQGMALYRVGQLLGHEGAASGISLTDYNRPGDEVAFTRKVNGRTYVGLSGKLALWVEEHGNGAISVWEETWIVVTDEPCRLHLHG